MRTRIRVVAAIASLSALLGLSGCWQEKHKWHQKLTVSVETPAGVVSGSAVTRIVANFGEQLMSASEVNYGVTGEATVVEVAPGRILFALLDGSEERFYRAVREQLPTSKRGEWLALIPLIEGAVELRHENYPLMVTFTDIADPKTVKRVDPDNLAASFGPGYRLASVTLEITDEPVTEGRVEQVLGWFRDGTTLKRIWSDLSPQQHDLLSSVNWKKD
ncbi:MAG: hypothetical protein K8H74_19480 [Notoacmeibacter sp.]|nr:hypothetical protein [Notoacmeibacter sp.]